MARCLTAVRLQSAKPSSVSPVVVAEAGTVAEAVAAVEKAAAFVRVVRVRPSAVAVVAAMAAAVVVATAAAAVAIAAAVAVAIAAAAVAATVVVVVVAVIAARRPAQATAVRCATGAPITPARLRRPAASTAAVAAR